MYRFSSLCAALTALLALGTSQSTLAQQTCADVIFVDEIIEAFPEAPDACLDITQRDGQTYARFEAHIVQVRGREVRARFKLPDGGTTDTYAFEPDPSARVRIQGRSYRYSELGPGQELSVYVPSDRWELAIPDQPDFQLAQVTVVTLYRPAPDDETVAALPRTATPLPLIALLGIAFTGMGACLVLIRRSPIRIN